MKLTPSTLSLLALFLILGVSSSCSTTGQSVGAGAAGGALLGAGVGAIADPGDHGQNRFRNVVIGTVAGGVLGAGAGYMMDGSMKSERDGASAQGKADALKEFKASQSASPGNMPVLVPAKTEAHWIPDQVRSNTWIPGHFEYQIIQSAHWATGGNP